MRIQYAIAALAIASSSMCALAEAPYSLTKGENIANGTQNYVVVSDNLIENGDFSKGISGWKYNCVDEVSTDNFTVKSGGPHDGNYLAALGNGGTGAAKSLQTAFELEKGKTYFFSFYKKGAGAYTRYGLRSALGDPGNDTGGASYDLLQGNITAPTSWTRYESYITVDKDWDNVYLIFNAAWIGGSSSTTDGFAWFNLVEIEENNTSNMMETAIRGYKTLSAPGEPWYAYKTSTNEFGSGNGWSIRSEEGSMTNEDAPAQLFLRWNDTDSKWVYAYKVSLEADHIYDFTVDAATNKDQINNLKVAMCQDLSTVSKLEWSTYDLTGHNENAVFTDPVKVSEQFKPATTGEYYIVFDSTLKTGNVIIRTANFSLTDGGVETGVSEIASESNNGEKEYYNLNGMKVSSSNLMPGIYVVREGSKTSKVLVGTL